MADVDFDHELGRRIYAQINLLVSPNARCILDIKAREWLEALCKIFALKSGRSRTGNIDLQLFGWTRQDPDLALLHGDPEFDRLYPPPKA